MRNFKNTFVIEHFRANEFAVVYLFKANNGNTRAMHDIYSKLTIKTPQRRQWRRSDVFNVVLTLGRFHWFFWCFHCWLWTSKCQLGSYHRFFLPKWTSNAYDSFSIYKEITQPAFNCSELAMEIPKQYVKSVQSYK